MSQAKRKDDAVAAGRAREWSTAYMAVAFGMGLALGFLFGGLYGSYWGERNAPLVEAEAAESTEDAHAGHDHSAHDHAGHGDH